MYDKKIYKCDVTGSWPLPLSHLLWPPFPSSVTFFMDGPYVNVYVDTYYICILSPLSTSQQRCWPYPYWC